MFGKRHNKTYAGVAQLVEQLICNQQVAGSSPITSSTNRDKLLACPLYMGEFPSGQRGQTVNLLSSTSMVRIHSLPPIKTTSYEVVFCCENIHSRLYREKDNTSNKMENYAKSTKKQTDIIFKIFACF